MSVLPDAKGLDDELEIKTSFLQETKLWVQTEKRTF